MSTVSSIYIGDISISEVPGSKYTKKRGVSDTLTRPYEGSVNLLQAFIAANPVLGALSGGTGIVYDYQYPWMVLTQLDASEDGPEAKCTLYFQGYDFSVLGASNNLQQSGSWEPRSVYLKTDNPLDGQWLVNYYSPTLTYKYVTNGINNTPLYQAASRSPATITILDAKQISTSDGVNPPNPAYVRVGNWVFTPFSVCTSFRFDQKGLNFDYQETWVVVIQPTTASGQGPQQLTIGGANLPPINP